MSAYEDATRAYMAGHKTEAQTLLGQALRANPRDQASWLLLAQCVDVVERQKYCLQQVLLINPKNPEALERLAELEKRPTPAFKTNTMAMDPEPTTPVSKPPTRPLAPTGAEPRRPGTQPLPQTTEEVKKPSTRPLAAIPLEAAEEPKKPTTRPLAAPPEPVEPKKPATQPLPPPPPAMQEILNARAQGGSNDETVITNGGSGPSQMAAIEPDEDFAPLPDAVPAVSKMESDLMDDRSFRPGPFSEAEQEPPEAEPLEESPTMADDGEDSLRVAANAQMVSDETADVSSTDDTLIGASAPVESAEPAAPAVDKAALRAKLEEAVEILEKGNKLDGIRMIEGILQEDPRNELAWMWLGAASYDVGKQRECYLRALEINPRNKLAKQRLDDVEDKLTAAGIALQPLATPLPPATPEPAATGSRTGLWIGLIFFVFALIVVVAVVGWVLTHR